MDIEGLDYNTQREPLVQPEYGREIQYMVDFAIMLPTKELRQQAANEIIEKMKAVKPQTNSDAADYRRTLWDHLYIISDQRLDIDWPFDMKDAENILAKPRPMNPPMGRPIRLRHYGWLLDEIFEQLRTMEPGPERDELAKQAANQMKRNLAVWGHGSMDDERVADDLARLTNGAIQLDLSTFKFEKVEIDNPSSSKQRKKKK